MSAFVYTGAQMKAIDKYAIENCGIIGLSLMENAARRIVETMQARLSMAKKNCVIVCGKGNNGGDGFAAACMLSMLCAQVQIVCLEKESALSADALYYSEKCKKNGIERMCNLEEGCAAIAQADVILDALYGFGFYGQLAGADLALVQAINTSKAIVFSADIPSGVSADCGAVPVECVYADVTITFTGYKLSAILFDSCLYYGKIVLADIGIPRPAQAVCTPVAEVICPAAVHRALGERPRNAHKGDFGKVFLLGGSRGMSGAIYMSAQAALKSGAGLVVAGVPTSLADIMEMKTTEVMTLALAEQDGGLVCDPKAIAQANAYDAVAFGMGAGRQGGIADLLGKMIAEAEKPLLLDADALYALAQNLECLRGHKAPIVITPHSGEMARLCGLSIQEIESDRIAVTKQFAAAYNVYVVLKGAHTVVAAPDGRIAVNCLAGNSGMATAGSGDVLAGVCAAMLSRAKDIFSTLSAAVYLHASAGDIVAADLGEDGMTACDMLSALPYAIKNLRETYNLSEGMAKHV